MSYHILTIIIALVFATSSLSVWAVSCNKADRAALIAFKDSFSSSKNDSFADSYPDWDASSTNDCCNWNHVFCDGTTGRVTGLFFSSNSPDMNLNGTIPGVIGNLTELTQIEFDSMPGLVGPIPPEMEKLKELVGLFITGCQITGSIPSFLSQLPSLQQIDLSKNRLVGTIPPSLAYVANLFVLSLQDNQLTGTIPPNLFSKLPKHYTAFLSLSNNNLKGTLPLSFADVNFHLCQLDSNKLEGDFSLLFGRNKTITSINMYSNNFNFDLTNVEYPLGLTYLDISRNEIYGSISNQITELPDLAMAVFSHNNLCGKIPSGGHFRTFYPDYFEHNKCLCGAPLKPCK